MNTLAAAIEGAAKRNRQDQPNNNDQPDYGACGIDDKPSPSKARQRALSKLKELMDTDPVFAELSMNTDGLHFYVPPPRAYYLAQISLVNGFIESPGTLDRTSAEIRSNLQDMVQGTDYAVGKNCCNKPMASWQLDRIAQAYLSTDIQLDTAVHQSISKIQRYIKAHKAGLTGGCPFRIDGVFLDDGIVVQDKKFSTFRTSTGYAAFKKDGKQFTILTIEKLASR